MGLDSKPYGSCDNPIVCHQIASEIGTENHCGTCHGNNIFDDDVCERSKLKDGRHAELCCLVKKRAGELGLLSEEQPGVVPPAKGPTTPTRSCTGGGRTAG